jgi:HD-like signal output (HDOD) protein
MLLTAALAVLVLFAVLAAVLLLRRPQRPQQATPLPRPSRPEPAMAAPDRPVAEAPPELLALRGSFSLLPAEALDESRRQALLQALQRLPRPPRALQALVSPEFVQRAASAQLAEIVTSEPAVAARVLAAVNSPLYGLQQPVASIGQAITFLGLSSVRAQCLQHLLDDAFKADDAGLQCEFAILWRASSIATELCQLLATRLRLGEPGPMVTLLVLSTLGRFAAALLLQRQPAGPAAPAGDGSRLRALQDEQARLGLASPEIGVLLMQAWALPASLAEEVRALGRLPLVAAGSLEAQQGARLALCACCARLGESLARGEITSLAEIDPLAQPGPDYVALRDHLARPALAGLGELLRGPECLRLLGRLQARV